jgi:hypothetical protein
MANFANSVLPAAIAMAKESFQQIENRDQEYGAIRAFRNAPPLELRRIERLSSERQRPASFRLMLNEPRQGDNALTCNPVGSSGDSVNTPLVWKTYTNELTISTKRQNENLYTTQEMTAKDLENLWRGTFGEMEQDALAYLEANRSQNDISKFDSTWVGATDYYNSIGLANKDMVRSIIRSEMRKARYTGMLNMVHTAPYDQFFLNTQIQGAGNARNYADQDGLFTSFYTNEDIDVTGTYGGLYVFQIGAIVMLTWLDPIFRDGGQNGGDKLWQSVRDPKFGMDWGVYRKFDCADTTTVGGGAQDLAESVQFSLDVAFVHAPVSSPANETPIHKYALATT